MSDFPMNKDAASAPHHHLHSSSEVLPGARGAAPTVDYSTNAMDDPRGNDDPTYPSQTSEFGPGTERTYHSPPMTNTFNESAGGAAIGGHGDLAESQAGKTDKLVGKTQKIIGKYTNNPEMYGKGEIRETSGKAAIREPPRASARHD